jgi:hypothetical protein
MADLPAMNTLSEIITLLQQRNIPEFKFTDRGFTIDDTLYFQPADVSIIKIYRFEGNSDPSDMSVVYVFETSNRQRAYSLNTYGVYDDQGAAYDNFIREVPEKNHGEQILFEL